MRLVQKDAVCTPLWEPFNGTVFRCTNPNGDIIIISKETFAMLELSGVVRRGQDQEKSLGRN